MNNGVGDLVSITFQCQFNVQSFPCMDDLFYTILGLYTLHVCFLKELVQAICTCTVRKKNPIVYYIYIVWKVTDLLIHKYVALNCSIKIGTICTMISAYRNDTRAYCHSNSCSHCSRINGASILFWKKINIIYDCERNKLMVIFNLSSFTLSTMYFKIINSNLRTNVLLMSQSIVGRTLPDVCPWAIFWADTVVLLISQNINY